MSDYKTRDMLIAENDLLREVIIEKNEVIRALQLGAAGQTRRMRAEAKLEKLKAQLEDKETVE